ncbi:hypothetical protein [Devosia sediminis]|uniref:Uncharacterized protein n=1 Tax=Devosia sediminis TaxID=2798801 RepID=A0A934IQM2_9HYPH|nr:hypothetical protein [Devosia sediminis]MBJ3783396.1 hypothetical protein [Devosia sediminis]
MTDTIEIPAHIQPYVDVLGLDLTIDFLLAFGGAPLYLPSERTQTDSRLAEVVGADKAVALGKQLGRGTVRVPIQKRFIAACLLAKNVPIVEIARKLHVSDVSIRRWLPDRPNSQLGLFD